LTGPKGSNAVAAKADPLLIDRGYDDFDGGDPKKELSAGRSGPNEQ
jgi:hypothetical protein